MTNDFEGDYEENGLAYSCGRKALEQFMQKTKMKMMIHGRFVILRIFMANFIARRDGVFNSMG